MNIKKILTTTIISFFLSNTVFGKINEAFYYELYEGCMETALKYNKDYNITDRYCKCSANHFNENYDDDSLILLVTQEGGAAYNDVVQYVIRKCRKKVGLDN